jgi:hypothetical protein
MSIQIISIRLRGVSLVTTLSRHAKFVIVSVSFPDASNNVWDWCFILGSKNRVHAQQSLRWPKSHLRIRDRDNNRFESSVHQLVRRECSEILAAGEKTRVLEPLALSPRKIVYEWQRPPSSRSSAGFSTRLKNCVFRGSDRVEYEFT